MWSSGPIKVLAGDAYDLRGLLVPLTSTTSMMCNSLLKRWMPEGLQGDLCFLVIRDLIQLFEAEGISRRKWIHEAESFWVLYGSFLDQNQDIQILIRSLGVNFSALTTDSSFLFLFDAA